LRDSHRAIIKVRTVEEHPMEARFIPAKVEVVSAQRDQSRYASRYTKQHTEHGKLTGELWGYPGDR
jgi:hypothetical protein